VCSAVMSAWVLWPWFVWHRAHRSAPPRAHRTAQLLKLQAENDSLKIQEIEDRRKIQHLLTLTEPLAPEVRLGHAQVPRRSRAHRSKQPARDAILVTATTRVARLTLVGCVCARCAKISCCCCIWTTIIVVPRPQPRWQAIHADRSAAAVRRCGGRGVQQW